MLLVIVVQAFVVGASAATLNFPSFRIQNPFDIIFGDEPWKHWPTPHPSPESMTVYETITNDDRCVTLPALAQSLNKRTTCLASNV
jgi:hypothetical protein